MDVRLRRKKSRAGEEQEYQQQPQRQISSETTQTITNRTRASTTVGAPVPKRTAVIIQVAAATAAGGEGEGRSTEEQQNRRVRTLSAKKSTDTLQQQQRYRRRSSQGTALAPMDVQSNRTPRPVRGTDEGPSVSLPELAIDQKNRFGIADLRCTEPANADTSNTSAKARLDPKKEPTTVLLRDVLAVKRKQVRQEFGLSSEVTTSPRTTSAAPAPTLSNVARRRSTVAAATAATDIKRRMSLGKEKSTPSVQEPRRRALSSGSILRANSTKCELGRRKSTTSGSDQPSLAKNNTFADMRRRSSAAAAAAASSSSGGGGGGNSSKEGSPMMAATKRSSAIGANRANGSRSTTTIVSANKGDDEAPAASSAKRLSETQRRRASKGSIRTQDSEDVSASSATQRTRKKSIVAMDDSSINIRRARRLSRTDSLKNGMPTSPSLNAALAWRKKSEAAYDAFLTSKESTKTLPGSLAAPPPIQSINLPPMKIEPIRIAIPGRTDKYRNRTKSSTGSSSSESDNGSQRSKKDDPDSIGKSPSIRTPRVAPVTTTGLPKETSTAAASPRSRPLHTRRTSATSLRKLSFSNSSSKNASSEEPSPAIGPLTVVRPKDNNSSIYGIVPARTAGLYANSRKNSIASITSNTSANIEFESVTDKEIGKRTSSRDKPSRKA
ncbi:hypothetical protein BX666DRAFT_1341518 [Dichotomocladium elegans]|nr:hypothetical protein BX666DRAFT_1341518 [Dichotomocladium elegans]